ncbi:MAG: RNA polymerase factor sigma-54 [Armatimonadetes bacterium]|nr:RNA polymerase factor sigma-54 [Armatimonadota bacterium]
MQKFRVGGRLRKGNVVGLRQNLNRESRLEQRAGLRVDPKIVTASRILQLQRYELEQAIRQELNDNPALERLDDEPEVFDEDELIKDLTGEADLTPSEEFDTYPDRAVNSDGQMDWVEFLVAPVSLQHHLEAQMLPAVGPERVALARHVMDCVNPNGYLDLPVEEIALLANADLDETREVVEALQACDPPGVGAADLRECLALQLRHPEDDADRVARAVVMDHWDALLSNRPGVVARRLRVQRSLAEEAFERISNLKPYPGEAFLSDSAAYRPEHAASVEPDVLYRRDETGTRIEIRGSDASEFALNRWYKERYRLLRSEPHRMTPEERKHVKEYVGRAVNFIRGVHQRKVTLLKIGSYLLKEQAGFISTGSYRFLKALTRVQVARAVGLHESTVSRATMGKFVQLDNGETVAFEVFFKPALRIQKMIEEILLQENPSRPLSDRQISEILKERGVKVARRTVTKYREQIRLLSSHRRRTA